MSTWRRRILDQFPEFGHDPERWDLIDLSSALGSMLERAARSGDREAGGRVIDFTLWLEQESKNDERFIYQCQDILRRTVSSASLRSYFASLLNKRSLAQLAGYIEYLTSKAVLGEIEEAVRLNRRGA
jgi:hypothetical protein